MRLSTKSRYGLRALTELVSEYGNGAIALHHIADEQQIPRSYLENLFRAMKIAGLVMSRRGPGGGWVLARPPDQIRLGEIIEALDGNLDVVDCVEHPGVCGRTSYCATREVYVEVSEAIMGVLNRYTLDDLHRRKIELDRLAPLVPEGDDLCMEPGAGR